MTNDVSSIYGMPLSGNFQYNPNPYAYDDLECDYSIYPGGMMGMNGSIFGMPPVGTSAQANNQNYFENMKEYQKFYIDYNIDQQKMQRNADMRINASMESIKNSATALRDKIINNEQDQIEDAYKKYVNAVGIAYGEGTPQEVISRAKTLYEQMTGKSIVEDIRHYGHGSMTQGFIQSLTFGTYNRTSAEDNVSKITGSPVGTGEKTKHNIGRLAGAGTIGAVAYGIAKGCKSGKAKIIGIAAGAIAAATSFLTGKVTT